MARLNESTASAEQVEILKRRFVRQNREIARVNSIQSLRIRGLEAEVSHLLSENVSLREQVITLTHSLERFEAAKTLHDGVYDVKARLDSKLLELTNLVSELGALPRRYSKLTGEKAESEPERQPRGSATKHSNDADLGPDFEPENNGRLPAILEDKCYPRRTLSAHEIRELSSDETDMPSSGSLDGSSDPQAQIVEDDGAPAVVLASDASASVKIDYIKSQHVLPPNLETRRKKKTDSAMVGDETTDTRVTSLLDSKLTRKCGAKRKFPMEDEDCFYDAAPAEDDGFEFSRHVQSPGLSPQIDISSVEREPEAQMSATNQVQLKRRVLEPKSTNINLNSPVKPIVAKVDDRQPTATVSPKNNRSSSRRQKEGGLSRSKTVSLMNPSYVVSEDHAYTNKDKEGVKVEITEDVPPQIEVSTATDIPAARPSRRRGAVVSYAEPNLRDKMRRSTNELGPAVNVDKPRKSSSRADTSLVTHAQKISDNSISNSGDSSNGNGEHNLYNHQTPQYLDARDAEGLEGGSQLPVNSETRNGEAISAPSRKSRRYSSNTNTSKGNIKPRSSTNAMNMEGVYDDLASSYQDSMLDGRSRAHDRSTKSSPNYIDASSSGTHSTEMIRHRPVASRRRSMML